MNPSEVNRFNELYARRLKTLKLQGNALRLQPQSQYIDGGIVAPV